MSASTMHLRSSAGLYGAEQMLLGLCSEQARRGPPPLLAAFAQAEPPALLQAAERRGLESFALACRGAIDVDCVRALRSTLRERQPAILHCHDYKSVVYGALAARGLALKLVATVHGWVLDGMRAHAYRALELGVLRSFDRVCAVSPTLLTALRAAGLSNARIRLVANGVELPAAPLESHPASDGTVRIGSAARLSPEKNLAALIRAVAACRKRGFPLELTILGEGPLRASLEALVVELGVDDAVRLPGARASLADWYPTLDALLLPSLSEGLPMSVLEALGSGCPVIASSVGALPEVLRGLPGCSVLATGDQPELISALARLRPRTAVDPALRQRVRERYSVERMADDYEDVYRGALAA